MRGVLILAATAAFLMACSGGGGDSESASDALVRQLGYASDGQVGRLWDELHPAQQAVVSRDTYMDCLGDSAFNADRIRAVEEYDETISVPEVGRVESKAITVEMRDGDSTDTETFHEVRVDGAWRWVSNDLTPFDDC